MWDSEANYNDFNITSYEDATEGGTFETLYTDVPPLDTNNVEVILTHAPPTFTHVPPQMATQARHQRALPDGHNGAGQSQGTNWYHSTASGRPPQSMTHRDRAGRTVATPGGAEARPPFRGGRRRSPIASDGSSFPPIPGHQRSWERLDEAGATEHVRTTSPPGAGTGPGAEAGNRTPQRPGTDQNHGPPTVLSDLADPTAGRRGPRGEDPARGDDQDPKHTSDADTPIDVHTIEISLSQFSTTPLSRITFTPDGAPADAALTTQGLVDCGSAATLLRTDVAERWGLLTRGAAIAGPGTPTTETVDLRGFDGKKKTVHLRRVSGHITVSGGAPVHISALVLDQLAHPMLVGRDWFEQVAFTNQGEGEWSSGIHRYERLADSTARRPAAPAPRPPTPAATPTPPPPTGSAPEPAPAEAIDIHLCSTADLENMLEAGEVESIALLSNVLDTVDSSLPTDAIVIDAALSELGAVKTDAAGVVHRAYELAKRTVPQLDVLAENDRSQKQRAINKIAAKYIARLKEQHASVFAEPKFGKATEPDTGEAIEHEIELEPGTIPRRIPPMRLSPPLREAMADICRRMLKDGRLEFSTSPFSSPAFLVKKKDGSFRLVVDLRYTNRHTVDIAYNLPNITEILEILAYATLISQWDEPSSFHNLKLKRGISREVTAFYCPGIGQLQSTVVVMGAKTSVAAKQGHLDRALEPFIYGTHGEPKCVAGGYLDDIAVHYGDTRVSPIVTEADIAAHFQDMHRVLLRLEKANISLNLVKCSFCRCRANVFSWVVGEGELQPDRRRVQAILDYPAPTTLTELNTFVGKILYYARAIQGFEALVGPLRALQQDKQQFRWGEIQERAFQAVKHCLVTAPLLLLPRHDRRFEVHVDTSTSGYTGAVLQQTTEARTPDGSTTQVSRPCEYYSRKMSMSERRMGAGQAELLGIVSAIEHWNHHLKWSPRPFLLVSDHKPIEYLQTKSATQLTDFEWRTVERLAPYPYDFEHRPGAKHVMPDTLSRPSFLKRKTFVVLEIGSGTATAARALAHLANRGELVRSKLIKYIPMDTAAPARRCTEHVMSNLLAADQELFDATVKAGGEGKLWTFGHCLKELATKYKQGTSHVNWVDMIIAGPSCRKYSAANPNGDGLNNEDDMFDGLRDVVHALYKKNNNLKVLIECTVFGIPGAHPQLRTDLEKIDGWFAEVGCRREEHDLSIWTGQSRRRYLWTNFPLEPIPVTPLQIWADVLDDGYQPPKDAKGRTRTVAPTVCARQDTYSRREPKNMVEKGGHRRYMTLLEEMRLQGIKPADLPPGLSETARYKLTGNAYPLPVIIWALRAALRPFLVSAVPTVAVMSIVPHSSADLALIRGAAEKDASYQTLLRRPPAGCTVRDRLIYRTRETGQVLWLPTTDRKLLQRMIVRFHDRPEHGHGGVEATTARLAQHFYWTGIGDDVRAFVASCKICSITKASNHATASAMHPPPVAQGPGRRISIDYKSMTPSRDGLDNLLVMIDDFSSFVVLVPCTKEVSAESTWELYQQHGLNVYGVPENVRADRGAQFTAQFFRVMWTMLGGEIRTLAAHNPAGNGKVERANRQINVLTRQTAAAVIDAAGATRDLADWPTLVGTWALAMNTSRLRSGFTPAFLHFGRELNGVATLETRDLDYSAFPTPNDYARNLHKKLGAAFRDQRAALEKYRARREAHRRTHPSQIFEVGDLVYIKRARSGQRADKTAPVYENTPVRVLERIRRPDDGEYLDTYRLDLPPTDQRHNAWPAQYLKKHVPSDPALWPDRRAEAATEIAEDDEILEIRHRDLRFIPPTYVLRTKASPGFVERVEHEIPDKLLLAHLNEHGVTDLNRPSDTAIAAGEYPRVWGHLTLLKQGVVPKYKAVAGEWRLTQAHNNRLYRTTGYKVVY